VESADASLQAAEEDRRDVMVTLLAEVALNYIDLRGFQQQIVVAQDNLKAQEKTAGLTHEKFAAGFVSGLDVANADAQVAGTASVIPSLETAARQSIYALSVLLGGDPGLLYQELVPTGTIPPAPLGTQAPLPSELLRRRPDIRRAEAQIHAATAQVGVATADLFPKFNLAGSAGFQSGFSNALFKPASGFWSLAPSVSWTIFDTGAILSNIDVQKALRDQAAITYRQTVLTALQDVENALIASANEKTRRKSLAESVAANAKAANLSLRLYANGQTDFLNVLNAQRSLFAAQDALVQSDRTICTNMVALYKALGGGWETQDHPPATSQPAGRR
jgi:outer membrane protein, multidrug efflux system